MSVRGNVVWLIVPALVVIGLPSPASAVAPAGLTPRFTGKGWLGLAHIEATAVGTDVDRDPSTVNSNQATLALPAHASVQWAGLHWGGDQGLRTDGTPNRCAGATEPATPPPAPDQTDTVRVSIADSPYRTVKASDLTKVPGRTGFQAYADLTDALRSYGGQSDAVNLPFAVAGVQLASGPGCTGGWSLAVVYGFRDGPDPAAAPTYGSLTVYDPVLATGAPASLTGLVTPAAGQVTANVTTMLIGGGPPVGFAVNGTPVAGAAEGTSYQASSNPIPATALAAGARTAALSVAGGADSFALGVLVVHVDLPAQVRLPVKATFAPATVAVGAIAQFTVTVTDDSDIPASGVVITSALPTGLTLLDGQPGYDAATGVWTVGTVAPHASTSITLNVRVEAAGSFAAAATVTASTYEQATPPTPATATLLAENVTPTTSPSDTGGTPAATLPPPDAQLWQPSAGVLVGAGIFGLGLLLLLIIMARRRAA